MYNKQLLKGQTPTSKGYKCKDKHQALVSKTLKSTSRAPTTQLHSCSADAIQESSSGFLLPSTRYTESTTVRPRSQKPLKITWAGAGIYFFWQLGALKYLQERYDLTQIPMSGASGGALAAVLGGCGVEADRILKSAYDLSLEHDIWERPLGLLGVWGPIIEKWLDGLLPPNAVELCQNRVEMIVTALPSMQQVGIKNYTSRQDLINVAMSSAHVPVLLDWKLFRLCRDTPSLDGSFPDFFTGKNCDLLECDGEAVVFDYFDDPNLKRNGRMDMLELKEYSEIQNIMMLGYHYAEGLHRNGVLCSGVLPKKQHHLGVNGVRADSSQQDGVVSTV